MCSTTSPKHTRRTRCPIEDLGACMPRAPADEMLYHPMPEPFVGDALLPPDRLADRHRRSRRGIASIPGAEPSSPVPLLGCLWNDVLHLSPVRLEPVRDALRATGHRWPARGRAVAALDPERIGMTAENTALWLSPPGPRVPVWGVARRVRSPRSRGPGRASRRAAGDAGPLSGFPSARRASVPVPRHRACALPRVDPAGRDRGDAGLNPAHASRGRRHACAARRWTSSGKPRAEIEASRTSQSKCNVIARTRSVSRKAR